MPINDKNQWIQNTWGDLTLEGKLSKEASVYKAMMQQIDYYWDIQQSILNAYEIESVCILSEN